MCSRRGPWLRAPWLALAFACAGAPLREPPAPECAPDSAGVPLAYELHAPDGSQAFLQGSMHLVRGGPPALHPRVEAGLRDAELLVLEIDPKESKPEHIAEALIELAMLPPGQRLRDVVSAETWQRLEARAAQAGTSLAPLEVFEPWVVALTLIVGSLTQVGFQPQAGTEQVALAAALDKQTLGLESAHEQLALFDSLSPADQEEMLRGALEGSPNSISHLDAIANAWRCGDAAGVEAAIQTEMRANPRLAGFYDAAIFGRNAGMAEGIADILQQEGGAFVVVGAAHLVGARGIPALLEQAGFRVEPMRKQP
jgi:uncharacterized protein YbaP (TraB family)